MVKVIGLTKLLHLLTHLTQEKRLQNLNLTSIEVRRDQDSLIRFYIIESEINKVK